MTKFFLNDLEHILDISSCLQTVQTIEIGLLIVLSQWYRQLLCDDDVIRN